MKSRKKRKRDRRRIEQQRTDPEATARFDPYGGRGWTYSLSPIEEMRMDARAARDLRYNVPENQIKAALGRTGQHLASDKTKVQIQAVKAVQAFQRHDLECEKLAFAIEKTVEEAAALVKKKEALPDDAIHLLVGLSNASADAVGAGDCGDDDTPLETSADVVEEPNPDAPPG